MLDHVFLSVSNLPASIKFYEQALAPPDTGRRVDYDGADGQEGHPDLKGFGSDGRVYFWLRSGGADARTIHVGFVADSAAKMDAAYAAAMTAGATGNGPLGTRLHYDPSDYAANFFDPDGYSIEVVYKSWQHPQD